MQDDDLTLRAGLASFMDDDGTVSEPLDGFDPLGSNDDCLRLLVATGISFRRDGDEILADDMTTMYAEPIHAGNVLAAARRAAATLAASWIHDDDLALYQSRLPR